jgi:hypothetical protein
LEKDDIGIAEKFTEALLERYGPMDLNLLERYRRSNFHSILRSFIRETISSTDPRLLGKPVSKALIDAFDSHLAAPHGRASVPIRAPARAAFDRSLALLVAHSPTVKLLLKRYSRRGLLKIGGIVAGSLMAESLFQSLPEQLAMGRDQVDQMVALIASQRSPSVWNK